MRFLSLIAFCFLAIPSMVLAQSSSSPSCGQNEVTQRQFNEYPSTKIFQEQIQNQLRAYQEKVKLGLAKPLGTNAVLTLPVVVHIIHNNGPENISDARVFTAIQHLNEAYANTGYYDPADGVNTQIQFCLAQRDPNNNPTNGIDRVQSSLTTMDGWNNSAQDLAVKNLSRWDPKCYINIWLVKEIIGAVAGYAYLPSAYGMTIDGIVGEAAYFGSSYPNDVLIIHEMGHYLGLYHTFQGSCKNDDCTKDGDQVCDTPPDQSTAGISCNSSVNSCSTDAQSGFSTDVNDLHTDYLDYGNWNCMKVFTQGQADRMTWMIQNVRKSLLACKSCMAPCPSPVTANFSSSSVNVSIGSLVNFTNTSVNGTGYKWYINNVYQSNTFNYSYTFNASGTYIIKLSALSNDPLCDSAVKYDTVFVTCPVTAAFTPGNGSYPIGQTINFNNSSVGALTYQWRINNIPQSASLNYTHTFSIAGTYEVMLVADNGLCRDSLKAFISFSDTVNVNHPQDTCKNLTFQKKIGGTGNEIAADVKVNSSNEYFIAGTTNATAPDAGLDALLIKLNKYGNKIWQKTFGGRNTDFFSKMIILKQGEYLAMGITNSFHSQAGSILMIKTDTSGNIIWQKEHHLQAQSLSSLNNITGIIELSDGSIAFCGNATGINTDVGQPLNTIYNFIGRTDKDGNMLWLKRSRFYYWESGYPIQGMVATDLGLVAIVGGGLMKVTQADGTLMGLQKQYDAGIFTSIERYSHSIVAYTANARLDLDTNANLVKGTDYRSLRTGRNALFEGFSSERGLIMPGSISESNISLTGTWLNQFSESGALINSFKLPFTVSDQKHITGTRLTNDKGIFGANINRLDYIPINSNGDIFIMRTDSFARMPDCPRSSFETAIKPLQARMTEMTIRFYPISNISYTLNLQPQNVDLPIENICKGECSLLQLSGPDTICSKKDTVRFIVKRNRGCNALTDWKIDSNYAQIISFTDSTLELRFKKAGYTSLYASIGASCKLVIDSLPINILTSPDSINLGPDISLCKISTYVLKAGPGFKSYKWSDGSTDSSLTVFADGIYYVVAEDYCGNIKSDTVVVTQAPDVPFDLGPDLEKCNNDSVTITAPAGFNRYYWSPDYKLQNTYARTIKAAPETDTMYTVIAEKSPGCLVVDSIKITVRHSAPVSLGADTSFCENDSIIVTATAGFNNYSWNTGAFGSSLKIKNAGTYIVAASDRNNCISRDTLIIKPLHKRPVVNLGADFNICTNSNQVFDAGNYISYLWQDGSTGSTFSTDHPGIFWVNVTDKNHCSNADTVTIAGFRNSAVDFIDSLAEICVGQKIEIKAKDGYTRYKWYNNSNSNSIYITSPGIYWVEVTNDEGCTSRDSISVKAKDCKLGVFFPNAFTPMNGGTNNIFRPIIYGQVESFHMVVYNRWGQKVFETSDPLKGWNGSTNGNAVKSDTYVWMAKYKFAGEKEKVEKGTVLLVR